MNLLSETLKRALEKQLDLLAERSQEPDCDLVELTNAMCNLIKCLWDL